MALNLAAADAVLKDDYLPSVREQLNQRFKFLAQVEKNGGIIVSVDGIQPEKGNETVAPFAQRAQRASAGC